MNSLVSIIIPTYNCAQLIGETLDSVLAQTYPHWECTIVDDGSTDDSEAVILQYPQKDSRFRYLKRPNQLPKGGNSCRNYGFEKSSGDFVQWFDADDLMHENKLQDKIQKLAESPCDFVVCEGVEFKDDITNLGRPWNQIYSDFPLIDHALGKIHYHTNGPMFTRCFLEGKKLFDIHLKRKQEWEFYTRLLSFSPKIGLIGKPLYAYRIHAGSINGRDLIATLSSRVRADLQVFNILKKKRLGFSEIETKIRKHFIHKAMLKYRIAKQGHNFYNMLYALFAICRFLSLSLLLDIFLKKMKGRN